MSLSLTPRGRKLTAMLYLSPLLAVGLSVISSAALFAILLCLAALGPELTA